MSAIKHLTRLSDFTVEEIADEIADLIQERKGA